MVCLTWSGVARRRAGGVAAAAIVAWATLGLSPQAAKADGGSFSGFAEARGLFVSVANASIPAVQGVEATVPFASSKLNSLGQSDSYGSAPYPGAVVANLFDVAGALVPVPVPEYPLQVATAAGDNPKQANFPGISLRAESGATQAAAKATVATDAIGGTSASRVEVLGDGSLQSVGDFTADVVNIGGLMTLSGVTTQAKVVADSFSGKLTRSSLLRISGFRVPAMNLTLPDSLPSSVSAPVPVPGLPQLPPVPLPPLPIEAVGGMTLQDPMLGFADGQFSVTLPFLGYQKYALPTEAVTEALKQLGITVLVTPAHSSTAGVTGSALSLAFTVSAPPDNPLVNQPTDVVLSLGGSTVTADLRPSFGDSGFALPGGGAAVPAGASGGSATDSLLSPGGGVADLAGDPFVGEVAAGVPGVAGAVGLTPASSQQTGRVSTAPNFQPASSSMPEVGNLYLLLVSVAGIVFVSASFLRIRGVRALWD